MIDEGRTLEIYGYTSDELSPWSKFPVIAVCEDCGKYRVLRNDAYRDLCSSCVKMGKPLRPFTPEHRRNMSDAKKGEKHPLFGKHLTPEHCRKIAAANTGEKNHNWKGGVTSWRKYIWYTPAHKNWRKAVFERDDYTCQMCDAHGGRVEAHHIRPVRDHKNDLMMWDINNGITLCKDCHLSINKREYDFVGKFEVILS